MPELVIPPGTPPVQRIEIHALDPEKANICIVNLTEIPSQDTRHKIQVMLRELLGPLGVKVVLVADPAVQIEFKEVPGEGNV